MTHDGSPINEGQALPTAAAASSPTLEEPDQSWTFGEIGRRAGAVQALYARKNIRLHPQSALGVLLKSAEALAEAAAGGDAMLDGPAIVAAAHAVRVSTAIESVQDLPEAAEALKRIASKNLDMNAREPSQGKDALWELELFSFFHRHGASPRPVDPPDIVIEFGHGDYGIACKKIYKEPGVDGQMRKGCRQLVPFNGAGLVALNIDDLVPPDGLLVLPSTAAVSEALAGFCTDFVARHKQTLDGYIQGGRCDGVLISTSMVAAIGSSRVRHNNVTEHVIYAQGASRNALQRLSALNKCLTNRGT